VKIIAANPERPVVEKILEHPRAGAAAAAEGASRAPGAPALRRL
jgi:hypothetical protein